MKGAYIFSFLLKKDCEIIIGKLGKINFKKGRYHYCGSAQNNLEKRIERHKRKEKKNPLAHGLSDNPRIF